MSVRLRFALLASSSLLLLFFFQLASAQTDPAACSVSCRFVIVPTLGPQGLPGLNGTKGDTGAVGQIGPIGPEGPKGDIGEKGDQGDKGEQGEKGDQGEKGEPGADGATGTFDLSSTHTGLKLEAPVLTGAISIEGAALTGPTSIGEGATITAPIIDGAALTGSTSIGEGATIVKPNITAPIIDGAAIIGEGSIIVRPNIIAPIIDGAMITQSTVNASVIKASETNGHFRMKKWGSLGISDPGYASVGYTMINVTITGSLVIADAELFLPSHTGGVLEWSDGAAAVIQTVGPFIGTVGSTNFTAARAFNTPRGWQMVKWWTANTMLSHNFAVFQDKIALKGTSVFGLPISAVVIDMTKMRVDAGVRHQTSWTFPHPGPAGQQNYFVGEESVQTLKNKKFDRITGGFGLTHAAVTSTTGSPQVGFASTATAGMVKANFQTPSANSIAWTLTLPVSGTSWLSLTPANGPAAALTGAQQVWVEHHNGGGSPPTNVFVCYMGATPLATGVTYAWVYHVIGGQ